MHALAEATLRASPSSAPGRRNAWGRLGELFRQVPQVLGNRASGFTLAGVPKSWDEVSERADYIIRACEVAEPPASGEIPGDYGT
jgi:hypothetical protein